jgi:hypothetical protein
LRHPDDLAELHADNTVLQATNFSECQSYVPEK